jgi:hypothetical protein
MHSLGMCDSGDVCVWGGMARCGEVWCGVGGMVRVCFDGMVNSMVLQCLYYCELYVRVILCEYFLCIE